MKPLLLLDIDGVLCPFGMEDRGPLRPITGHDYATFNPHHTPWLLELQDLFDIAWASFWDEGGKVLEPIHGMNTFPHVEFNNENCYGQGNWKASTPKLQAIREFVKSRPVAWVDDDLMPDAWEWARTRNILVPTLLVNPEPTVGLDEAAMEQLRKFAKET